MRVQVDYDLCEGNGVCANVAPEVFVVGDDDRARLLVERPDESQRARVEQAVRRCPRQALRLIED
jgi:ferredoxin